MVVRTTGASLAAALVSLTLGGSAVAQNRPSTRDMERFSATAADRMVRRDLLSVLEHTGKLGSGMLRQFRQAGFLTAPVGSDYDGLCRRDFLSVRYAPTESRGALEDQPLKPFGVEVGHSFHVVRLPTTSKAPPAQRVWARECTGLSRGDEVAWFGADDADQAARAVHWMAVVTAQASAGTLPIKTCNRYPTTKLTCPQIVAAQRGMADVISVETCPADPALRCLAVSVGDTLITIFARPGADALDPGEIVAVDVVEQLVIS